MRIFFKIGVDSVWKPACKNERIRPTREHRGVRERSLISSSESESRGRLGFDISGCFPKLRVCPQSRMAQTAQENILNIEYRARHSFTSRPLLCSKLLKLLFQNICSRAFASWPLHTAAKRQMRQEIEPKGQSRPREMKLRFPVVVLRESMRGRAHVGIMHRLGCWMRGRVNPRRTSIPV